MLTRDDDFIAMCGASEDVLASMWEKTGQEALFPWFKLAACIAKLDLTNDAAAALCPLFLNRRYDERHVRRQVDAVFEAAEGKLMDPTIRFRKSQLDSRFPNCTGIVDVTTIACRARLGETTYSGKHSDHVWKLEVWSTLQGIPFYVSPALPGRQHDMKVLKETPKFAHVPNEFFLADLGYVGASHMIHEWKKNEEPEDSVRAALFNDHIHVVRSRIERLFSWVDEFKIFGGTDRGEASTSGFAYLAFSIMHAKMWRESGRTRYEVEQPLRPVLFEDSICPCSFACTREEIDKAKAHRLHCMKVQEEIGTGYILGTKKPQKRAR